MANTRRDVLCAAGIVAIGSRAGFRIRGDLEVLGRDVILQGLDGMSRVADEGLDPFRDGHGAAAVIASTFFCREQALDEETQGALLALMRAKLLDSPIHAPRAKEPEDPKLVDGLVEDLDAGIGTLRRGGHNVIFAVLCLNALREVPEAATPARIEGLRRMVRSFGKDRSGAAPEETADATPGLDDVERFVAFAFEEYSKALDLYLRGRGHHGFAGHLLTFGHALVELHRMGHAATAKKGLAAYRAFVRDARRGADLGGAKVEEPAKRPPRPLEREYWLEQARRRTDRIVSSHLIKYPYSFYALLEDLPDGETRERALARIHHLTAVS